MANNPNNLIPNHCRLTVLLEYTILIEFQLVFYCPYAIVTTLRSLLLPTLYLFLLVTQVVTGCGKAKTAKMYNYLSLFDSTGRLLAPKRGLTYSVNSAGTPVGNDDVLGRYYVEPVCPCTDLKYRFEFYGSINVVCT